MQHHVTYVQSLVCIHTQYRLTAYGAQSQLHVNLTTMCGSCNTVTQRKKVTENAFSHLGQNQNAGP